jgi:predicted HD phosphohydrolase
MWAAIKTDLHDFLTSAATDETIDSLDDNNEALHDGDGVGVVDNDDLSNENDYVRDCNESPVEEALRLSTLVETYTVPLVHCAVETGEYSGGYNDDESNNSHTDEFHQHLLQQFLESFNIDEHADEISEMLGPLSPVASTAPVDEPQNDASETSEQTECSAALTSDVELSPLQTHYYNLVPSKVTHEEFWTRYCFRCNPTLIAERRQLLNKSTLSEQDFEFDTAIQEVSEAALQIGTSAATILKKGVSGAIGAFHSGVEEAFVVGALKDDESYIESVEYSEEASLGWDSANIHDEVAFIEHTTTPLKLESIDVVKIRRTLIHAEEERNRLMEMVDERNVDIARLKCVLETDSNGRTELDELKNKVIRLKNAIGLIAARSAIGELKAKIDTTINNSRNASAKLNRMIHEEYNKQTDLERKLAECKKQIEQARSQKREVDERSLTRAE